MVHLRHILIFLHICQTLKVFFSWKFFCQKSLPNLLKPLIPFNSQDIWKFSIEWKFQIPQSSKSYVETCKFRNSYFGISIFSLFQISFWFKTYQWLQKIQWVFSDVNFAGRYFFRMIKNEKKPNLNQNCPKMVIRNFRNFDRRCFK